MKNFYQSIVLAAFFCALISCSHGQWYKDGATQYDFANDKQYCELYARALNDNNTWSRSWTEAAKQKQCMYERGWAIVDPSKSVSSSSSSAESRTLASPPQDCHQQCDSLYENGSLRAGMNQSECYKAMCGN